MRFDSYSHVLQHKMTGAYPAIHDDIFALIEKNVKGNTDNQAGEVNILDIGCCHGLLSVRIAEQIPFASVYGIDADNRYIKNAITERASKQVPNCVETIPNVKYQQFTLDGSEESLGNFAYLLKEQHVQYVVARRVFPEIWEAAKKYNIMSRVDGDMLPARHANAYVGCLANMMNDMNIAVFIEGRKPTKNPVNELSSIEDEVSLFQRATGAKWRITDSLKECRFLTPVIYS